MDGLWWKTPLKWMIWGENPLFSETSVWKTKQLGSTCFVLSKFNYSQALNFINIKPKKPIQVVLWGDPNERGNLSPPTFYGLFWLQKVGGPLSWLPKQKTLERISPKTANCIWRMFFFPYPSWQNCFWSNQKHSKTWPCWMGPTRPVWSCGNSTHVMFEGWSIHRGIPHIKTQ